MWVWLREGGGDGEPDVKNCKKNIQCTCIYTVQYMYMTLCSKYTHSMVCINMVHIPGHPSFVQGHPVLISGRPVQLVPHRDMVGMGDHGNHTRSAVLVVCNHAQTHNHHYTKCTITTAECLHCTVHSSEPRPYLCRCLATTPSGTANMLHPLVLSSLVAISPFK